MELFWYILIAAVALTVGFFFGLLIGHESIGENPIGELIIATDGEDYTMRLDIDRKVTGVEAEQFIMARNKVVLDVTPLYLKNK